jgi:hypothetical protein
MGHVANLEMSHNSTVSTRCIPTARQNNPSLFYHHFAGIYHQKPCSPGLQQAGREVPLCLFATVK